MRSTAATAALLYAALLLAGTGKLSGRDVFASAAAPTNSISTGRDFALALSDPAVTQAQLRGDITLAPVDFEGLPVPIVVARPVLISAVPGSGEGGGPPSIFFQFLQDMVRRYVGAPVRKARWKGLSKPS